jgi:hypothetical protein
MAAKAFGVGILLVFGLLIRAAAAQTMDVTKDVKEAQQTIAVFKKADPGLSRFFDNAVGYAVFPTVTKGRSALEVRPARASCSRRARPLARRRSPRSPSAPSSVVKPTRKSSSSRRSRR